MSGSLLHWLVWRDLRSAPASADPPAMKDGGLLKPVANAFDALATPGWVIARFVSGLSGRSDELPVTIAAHGIAWAGWVGSFGLLTRLRSARPESKAFRPSGTGHGTGAERDVTGDIDTGRRRVLIDSVAAAVGVAGTGSWLAGTLREPWRLRLTAYEAAMPGLAAELDGLRLVQLSDLHLGPNVPSWLVEEAIARALACRPDIVLLTGDYVHAGRRYLREAASLLAAFPEAGLPTVGVLGNHDWYGDAPAMSRLLSSAGVVMLDNRRTFVDPSTRRLVSTVPGSNASGPSPLCLAGVGDFLEDYSSYEDALHDVPARIPRLVLSHNPDASQTDELLAAGTAGATRYADLIVSGHTHGGQISLPFIGPPIVPSQYGRKYAWGAAEGPCCPVLTSCGVGMTILPVRLGTVPEIVLITLRTGPDRVASVRGAVVTGPTFPRTTRP
ncbi:MAG: metallophosphoesterase [Phycisphaerae bacterium]|nr:metallophosphoesterase [Phycisphaerae bacterium]